MTSFVLNGNVFKLAPQTAKVLNHLRTIGDISGVEAQAIFKVRSLTKRMSEINDALYKAGAEGYGLHNTPVEGQWSIDSTGQRYKRYVMPEMLRYALLPIAA